MSEWQPIETAPTDGTTILLYGDVAGEINGPAFVPSVSIGYYDYGSGDFSDKGYTWNSMGGDAYSVWVKPTHWMPLPEPPKEDE